MYRIKCEIYQMNLFYKYWGGKQPSSEERKVVILEMTAAILYSKLSIINLFHYKLINNIKIISREN